MVGCGWFVVIAGLLGGIFSDTCTGRKCCHEIPGVRFFLTWIWHVSYTITTLCLMTIQCRTYVLLRRRDAMETTYNIDDAQTNNRRCSLKTSRILFRFTVPTFILLLIYLSTIVVMRVRWPGNPDFRSTLGFVLYIVQFAIEQFIDLSILMNVVVYSYKTENIKRPVNELCNDVRKLLCPRSLTPPGRDGEGVTVALAESSV